MFGKSELSVRYYYASVVEYNSEQHKRLKVYETDIENETCGDLTYNVPGLLSNLSVSHSGKLLHFTTGSTIVDVG